MALDKVTLQIFSNHCTAAAEAMARTLIRTAHSTFVKESEDFTCGLVSPDGKTFAAPFDFGATWFVGLDYGRGLALIDHYEDGDVIICNDPYSGFVCTHSPDMHIWKPIFHEGELVCFAVGHVHNTDIGGAVPASLSRQLTEVHQEGLRLPPTKLYRAGVLNQELLNIITANVRMPDQNWGDMKAQYASVNIGEAKVKEIIARFGAETFSQGVEDLLDLADAQARRVIGSIPDGEHFFADYMDEDSPDGYPARIALNLIVKGDGLIFDYTGSDPQLASSINIPTGGDERHVLMMVGAVYVLYTLDPTILRNSGLLRACRCILPDGSLMNPQFPAAVGMRSLGVGRLMSVIFGAFAQALPERLQGGPGCGGPLLNVRTTDNRTGKTLMANVSPITAGAGASAAGDGSEGCGANQAFFKNTPAEINEADVPIRILEYGLAPDTAGPGKHRGGLSTTMLFQVFAPHTVLTARNRDRSVFTPWGIAGGSASKPSQFIRNPGTDNEINLGNTDVVTANPGDVFRITAAGGGGWGPAHERDVEAVLSDCRGGCISVEGAEEDYGVVIHDGAVDEDATRERRRVMAAQAGNEFFGHSPGRIDFEKIWTLPLYDRLTDVLARMPVNWRFFVKHHLFAAIEALDTDEVSPDALDAALAELLVEHPQLQEHVVAAE
ncbi:MAG: hydantoinase B/oxoprolinase family protein [Alphaproteobacteria bacterium]|jgi:N-methylhydantoinase B|nr:hydantoinase B/oxoprolinase family protein [Rhodospirillaceae bacterium]MBT6512756.1 hydantoinase B/oxoprolinase family protein [Rhodospirillaceae bacterium]MBT7613736.1 hydantoinase B/oxoprolinase family protein [Rhodospirillaceae bacterium]MDG2482482.1 hydantoinase B/oxoprolinase family protein [Alphaproteobacteria bacterium]